MAPDTLQTTPPAQDHEAPQVIPLGLGSQRTGVTWAKIVLGSLVVFSLALAVLVWRQLLRSIP
jgi:hypothetical protein